jgi:hypothetical protein
MAETYCIGTATEEGFQLRSILRNDINLKCTYVRLLLSPIDSIITGHLYVPAPIVTGVSQQANEGTSGQKRKEKGCLHVSKSQLVDIGVACCL